MLGLRRALGSERNRKGDLAMATVSQLGYAGIGVSDAGAWERFATGILGMSISERGADGALKLRMDDHHYRIAIHPGGDDDLVYLGWEVPNRETLAAIAEQLKQAGVEVSKGPDAEARERKVVELIKFRDPNGIPSEVFYGPLLGAGSFKSPRAIGGFVTAGQGLGHTLLVVDDLDRSMDFYIRALGMRISDYVIPTEGPIAGIRLGFLHCNPRHHSLAMFPLAGTRRRLNHIMMEVNAVDDVGATYELCQDQKIPIAMSLGRHTNDRMLSFYMVTPSGFMIEYGWGGRQVDDSTWQVQVHTSGSAWGHRPAMPR
jgi:2,3-dihydroxybiphenyl 1,2-dioxygenase